jgi:spore coat polysaccharide biosynthesis protein SpsF (cytidylyltransferase family)
MRSVGIRSSHVQCLDLIRVVDMDTVQRFKNNYFVHGRGEIVRVTIDSPLSDSQEVDQQGCIWWRVLILWASLS